MCGENVRQQGEICYKKLFSELGEYQQAYQITYRLQPQAQGCLVTLQQGGGSLRAQQALLQLPAERATQVLKLLYENAVSIELWLDVLAELQVPFSTT